MPGFTSGFTGGVALTLGLAYLTVLSHERNRHVQALHLRSQSQLLTSLLDPVPLPYPPPNREIDRQSRSIFTEIAKDRWNKEIEKAIRWVQITDWTSVREGMESAVARLLRRGIEKSRLEIEVAEQKSRPKIQMSAGASKAVAEKVAATDNGGASTKDDPSHASISSSQEITSGAKDSMDRGFERIHETADKVSSEIYDESAATVNAARGAVQNVLGEDLEKGKELIDEAQAVIKLEEKLESRTQAKKLGMSEIEKAFQERYEKKDIPGKTVEEVLEERYKPIDQRDRTSLRGL